MDGPVQERFPGSGELLQRKTHGYSSLGAAERGSQNAKP